MMGNLSFKKLSAITIMFGAIAIGSGVMAGQKVVQSVTANETYISGNFADSRNSDDGWEMMATYDYGTFMYIFGQQYDGGFGGCFTDDATVMAQLRAANSDAHLNVTISDGTCGSVAVVNSSRNAPKNH